MIGGDETMQQSVKQGISEIRLEHWFDFVKLIKEEHANCPAYIYRGQANADWKVESTLDRLERQFPRKKNYLGGIPSYFACSPADRTGHFNAFKEVARGKRGPSAAWLPDDEWWAHSRLMYYIDPHVHMVSRTTDDYVRMARCGCVAVSEPAFWAGLDRPLDRC